MEHKVYLCECMTEDPFALLGLGIWLIVLLVAFRALNRYQKKRPPVVLITVLLHTICTAILLICIIGLTWLLYHPVLELFNISTDGFMNLNGIFAAGIIWTIVCLFSWVAISKSREQAGSYYKTLLISLIVLALLPLLLCFLFLFLAGLK